MTPEAHRIACTSCKADIGHPCKFSLTFLGEHVGRAFVHATRAQAWERSPQARAEFVRDLAAIGATPVSVG